MRKKNNKKKQARKRLKTTNGKKKTSVVPVRMPYLVSIDWTCCTCLVQLKESGTVQAALTKPRSSGMADLYYDSEGLRFN